MTTKHLSEAITGAKLQLVEVLTEYVREHGEEPTDYDINEFGLTEQDDGEGEITHVLNLFDNGGCYFAVQNRVNDDDIKLDNIEGIASAYRETYDVFTHYAFQCLYIVKDDDGDETLKYYAFENGSIVWDDDDSEPDHDRVISLDLEVLTNLFAGIIKEWSEESLATRVIRRSTGYDAQQEF